MEVKYGDAEAPFAYAIVFHFSALVTRFEVCCNATGTCLSG